MAGNDGSDYALATITQDGEVPSCRMENAATAQNFARRLRENDQQRSYKRSKVDGIVGGFPPYQQTKLKNAGLGQICNANFNTSASYMNNAAGAFYDLYSEAPGHFAIKTTHGTPEQREDWSRIMSAEADKILSADKLWDYNMQRSQWEMVLHGCGPLFFEDAFRVFPRSIACGDLKIPERTQADIEYYDACTVELDYYPPQLFEFIQDEQPARRSGWRVDYTRKCIANAMNIQQQRGLNMDWEFYEQQLKANSLEYVDETKVIQVAFVFWKEFDGRISQGIVERESTGAGDTKEAPFGEKDRGTQYLFIHVGRYENWSQALQAMYFDRGNGGWHHTVTGLGTLMYSAMEFENRGLCRLWDGVFAPKVAFKPTTSEAKQKMQLAHYGDYGVIPAGWDAIQMPISGLITEGLQMYQTSSNLMRSNLSSYRQPVTPDRPGNPETKYGRMMDASQQSSLSKTTFARYYRQLDQLYAEIVRRLCIFKSPDKRASQFQRICMEQGVERECFGRIEGVQAVRVLGGEGSSFMRKSAILELSSVVSATTRGRTTRMVE